MEADFTRAWDAFGAREKREHQALADERYALANRERAAKLFEFIENHLHMDLRARRVLDVGSGFGAFPIVAASRGAQAFGVEPDETLHRLALENALNEKGEITLLQGELLEEDFAAKAGLPFDLIVLNELERVYDLGSLFGGLAPLSHDGTVINFTVANGECWQTIEAPAPGEPFGLPLLEPAEWGRATAKSFSGRYYHPLANYQFIFKAIGFSHLYLRVDSREAAGAVERVTRKFAELEARVLGAPFATARQNEAALRRFKVLQRRLAYDLATKDPIHIHLLYDCPVWQGFASRNAVQTLEKAGDLYRMRLDEGGAVAVSAREEIAPPPRRRLVITIDVEASPYVQSEEHVDRLIWGRFGNREVGIGRMMDVADRHGCKLTFFVDYCEVFRYPGAFERISREIVDRGHDLQLHAHMDLLPEEFWERHGLKKYSISVSDVDRQRATILLDFLLESARSMGPGCNPVAFRGGNFRFNNELLKQLVPCGVPLDFNYNIQAMHQPNNAENLPFFKWNNGVCEFPLANLFYNGWIRYLDFNGLSGAAFSTVGNDFIDRYYQTFPAASVAVMIMHSWSFCYTDPDTRFKIYKDERLVEDFDRFLANLPVDVEVVTASDLQRLVKEGELDTGIVRDVELADKFVHKPRGL